MPSASPWTTSSERVRVGGAFMGASRILRPPLVRSYSPKISRERNAVQSTMMDFPLTLQHIFRHGRKIYGNSQVVTWTGGEPRRASFGLVADRAERLAAALKRLGVGDGDRVGTLQWNNQEHLEAYMAVPCMGAVLHTLNLRLFSDQLAFIINHAEDKVVIVDGSGDASVLGDGVLRYEELIAAESPGFAWPELDERAAAAMCYTTGTTGDPKGVV